MIIYTSATTPAADVTTYFKLVDPSTGVPETGLTITDLDATYVRDRAAAVKADLTALAAVDSAHGDNQAIQIDATNAPGLYRVDWPDAAFAAGVSRVQLVVNGAAIDPAVIEVELLTPVGELGYLKPTTAGRTLDVSATGEAGVDWANVGSPTTTVGLSGTTIKTATDVETDTQDIQSRLPAALTANGNIKASLVEILTTALTETAGYLAAGFKKFFNVLTPVMTVESVNQTGDSYALVSTEVAEILADTNELQAEFVDGGRLDLLIDGIKAKTDLIPTDPAETSDIPSAATIADAVWDELETGHTTAGKAGQQLWTDVDAILDDTDDIGVAGAGLTEAGGTGDHLTALPWNASWDTEVQSEATDALNVYDPPTKAELDSGLAGLNDPTAAEVTTAVLTTAMTEAYAADGAAPTLAQALMAIQQFLQERSITGTTMTVKKLDGSTSAMTFTLNDATTPTAITRAT